MIRVIRKNYKGEYAEWKASQNHNSTIAQLNEVSLKQATQQLDPSRPARITLPRFFNVPRFEDERIDKEGVRVVMKAGVAVQKKLRDLTLLAQGMKRAKNIKEQSRSYFIHAAVLHNNKQYAQSASYLQKFLKIVIEIRDQRSIELALNALGIAYFYLHLPQKAMTYHMRHMESNPQDYFYPLINIGMCLEVLHRYEEARQHYLRVFDSIKNEDPRKQCVQKLVQRVNRHIQPNGFITQRSEDNIIRNQFKENFGKVSHSNRSQYNEAKVNYAICQAQENIEQYFNKIKGNLNKI